MNHEGRKEGGKKVLGRLLYVRFGFFMYGMEWNSNRCYVFNIDFGERKAGPREICMLALDFD